jgi:hypothetical protein
VVNDVLSGDSVSFESVKGALDVGEDDGMKEACEGLSVGDAWGV